MPVYPGAQCIIAKPRFRALSLLHELKPEFPS
jgi:hypothetical protein